jgi:tripartite-type tricarboxylate transporter receptor subunit TctC
VREGTPPAIINQLHSELTKAASAPDVVNSMAADGARPMTMRPDDFGSFIGNEIAKWKKVTRAAGINAN